MSSLPTALNLRYSMTEAMVEANRLPSFSMQKYLVGLGAVLESMYTVNVANYGASGNDTFDDTEAFNRAVQAVVQRGGGNVYIPAGVFKVNSVTTPAGNTPIRFIGDGIASVVKRNRDLNPGVGMFDVNGSNVSFENFTIDGNTLTPVGLQYGSGFSTSLNANDPMAPSLTNNTSIWVHGGTENFFFNRMTFQHTAGYALLLDAMLGDINDVDVLNCIFKNNRPTLFGTTPGDLIYGSWNGGVFLKGDGAITKGVVNHVFMSGCKFERNTGNCVWSHLYALDRLHSDFRFIGNEFLDCGLDGILIGGVTGGAVSNNVMRRVGYTTLTDADRSTPRWLPNAQATGLDSSGLVKGVDYTNNSFTSVNGGSIDADGHGMSVIGGNLCRIPYPDEAEYEEDQIAICGPTNSGQAGYSINLGNTQNSKYGGRFVNIVGNTLINMKAGSVRLFSARDCLIEANNIVAPDEHTANCWPIMLGPGGVGANQRSTGNYVKHNRATWSPAAPAPLVIEDPSIEPFVIGDVNQVFGNCPIDGNGMATEFQNDPNSGSPVWLETPWFS